MSHVTAARFDGDLVTHAVDNDYHFHGHTRCGRRVEWLDGRSGLEPRHRRFGYRVEDFVDCMTCLVHEDNR